MFNKGAFVFTGNPIAIVRVLLDRLEMPGPCNDSGIVPDEPNFSKIPA
jgi:hypothetical protein